MSSIYRKIYNIMAICLLMSIHQKTWAQAGDSDSTVPENPVLRDCYKTLARLSSRQAPEVYLHLDKSIYLLNEKIYFTAYLLDQGGDSLPQRTIYVVLADPNRRTVITFGRFLMKDEVGSGDITVPDTLADGEYLLLAYTNARLGKPAGTSFSRMIRIRSERKEPFSLAVELTGQKPTDSFRLRCKITTDYSGVASGGLFRYWLESDGHLLNAGEKVIDAFGEVTLSLAASD
ncbi:MAG TPA: hypothetical protein VK518_20280, partial [Puia sp.]|nr:hypothetical protein [Puia sp.]